MVDFQENKKTVTMEDCRDKLMEIGGFFDEGDVYELYEKENELVCEAS